MKKLIIVTTALISLLCNPVSYLSAGETSGTQRLECSENCESMIKQLKKYSRNGSPQAQTILALSYKSGELLETIDNKLAWKWMKRARNQNYPPALFYISQWYRQGYNTDIDVSKANEYLERSAKKKYPPALIDLGILYIQKNNTEEGISLIEEAAKTGHPKAKQLLMSFKPQASAIAEVSNLKTHPKTITGAKSVAQPVDEVITILGDELEPFYVFENILVEIDELNIYDKRGTTGTRLGDLKCGQPGSGCRVIYVNGSEEFGDIIKSSNNIGPR